jgi:hypothetical protein
MKYHFLCGRRPENKTNRTMGLSLGKNNNNLSSNPNLTPVVVYAKAKLQPFEPKGKKQIPLEHPRQQENKGKTGIYRWVNKVNGKNYIGSAVDFAVRFNVYYSDRRLNASNMVIYKALLKHDSNFKLEILEYCDKEDIISREQHYLDIFKPEYNINPTAGSLLGFRHSEETKNKISEGNKRKICSEETRDKMSVSKKGNSNGKNQPTALRRPSGRRSRPACMHKNWSYWFRD